MAPADLGFAFGLGLAGSGVDGRGVNLPHVRYHFGRLIRPARSERGFQRGAAYWVRR